MPVTVICNVSQRMVVVNRLELGGGWGSAPDWRQAGSRALEQQRLGCQRGSGRRSGQPPSYYLFAIRAALARPCVAADARASGRTLRACCPLGAPLGGCSTSRRAAPCPRCSRGTLPKGTPVCGSRTARPANHPVLAGGSLRSPPAPPPAAAYRPARGVAAGTVCAIMQGQAAPMARRHCRPCIIAQPVPYRGPGRTSPVGQRAAAARGLSLAPPWWGQATGPITGLGRLARPGLYNGPYSGARALSGPRAHSRAPGGGHCSQRWARYRGLIIWGRCPQPPGAAAPQARAPPYLDTLVTTHVIILGCKSAKKGITKAPVAC